jgi:CBS domain containing-hemolysin-like protein
MDSSLSGLVAVAALVLANGFFVATEFAIVAVRRSRIEQLEAAGHSSAKAARDIITHLDTYIAACQLGITMASLALGWIGEPALAHLVEPPLELLAGSFATTLADGVAIAISFGLITALHIVIGELAPKGLALQRPEATALAVARPMQIFESAFRLPIRLLNGVGNAVLRLFGLQPASGHEIVHTVDEVRLLLTGMQQAGVVDHVEARIAGRAFQFGEITIGELMTPRTELAAAGLQASMDQALDVAVNSGHNRLVLYDGSIDNIIGMTHLRELVSAQRAGVSDLRSVLRPVLIAPATKPADELLEQMRIDRRQLAVVLDEYGGTAGIVTLENLFEALVGPIHEEDAAWDDSVHAPQPLLEADGSVVLDGLTRLDELEELTAVRVPARRRAEVDTIGGLVMAELGRMPNAGDEVAVDGHRLRVEALDGRRVAAVRLLPIAL